MEMVRTPVGFPDVSVPTVKVGVMMRVLASVLVFM